MHRFLRLLGCLTILCLSVPAHAAKVAVENPSRMLPASAYLIGSYDGQGRPDVCVIDRAGIAETPSGRMIFYVGIRPGRQTARNIEETGAFSVNVPGAALLAQADYCGKVSAMKDETYFDKFAVTGLKQEKGAAVNAPVLKECPVVMECKVVQTREFPGGQHKVFFGEVISYSVDSEVLEGDKTRPVSQYDPIKAGAPVYFAGSAERSGYYALSGNRGHRGKLWQEKFPQPNGLEVPSGKKH
ncbi:MAG: flavin reductase family protein [Fretibacterium sp.]|nr:flavin reductase family protein [Fretibacterium sp.]